MVALEEFKEELINFSKIDLSKENRLYVVGECAKLIRTSKNVLSISTIDSTPEFDSCKFAAEVFYETLSRITLEELVTADHDDRLEHLKGLTMLYRNKFENTSKDSIEYFIDAYREIRWCYRYLNDNDTNKLIVTNTIGYLCNIDNLDDVNELLFTHYQH